MNSNAIIMSIDSRYISSSDCEAYCLYCFFVADVHSEKAHYLQDQHSASFLAMDKLLASDLGMELECHVLLWCKYSVSC